MIRKIQRSSSQRVHYPRITILPLGIALLVERQLIRAKWLGLSEAICIEKEKTSCQKVEAAFAPTPLG